MNIKTIKELGSKTVNNLNHSKILIGIAMIMFNIGSKYLVIDLSKNQEQFMKNGIIRRVTLFCIFFVATRDIYVSFLLTAAFVIIAQGLFNQDSRFFILGQSFYDSNYTSDEYEQSKIIIKEYEKLHPGVKK